MREIQPGTYNQRRKKRKQGCGGCLGKLIFFIVIFSALGFLGSQAFQSLGFQNRIMQTQYPVKYQEFVEEYAGEFHLEPALVYAVIRTESKFDPYAVSSAQAKGLMQLQDETAQDCARALKLKNFTADSLFDPQINIRLGCYYLGKLIKSYDGSVETAVAAYNGGPGNVEKWLKDKELINEKGELVHVPFTETRNYVENVMKAYKIYQELYAAVE